MKTVLLLIFASFLFFSCKNNSEPVPEKNDIEISNKIYSLEGAWEIVSYLNYRPDGSVDTIKSSNTTKQIKMYSATKVMWTRLRASDSLDWFGYGDYKFENGALTEILDFGSKPMNIAIKEKNEFVFDIIISANAFTQIHKDGEGTPLYAENYKRIE